MKVQHKRSGNVADVISQDSKQIKLRFANGEEQSMAVIVFRRWWKQIDDEPDEQTKKAIKAVKEMPVEKVVETVEKTIKKAKAEKAVKQLADDDKCGDGTPLAEIGKELLEQAKKKAEQTRKSLEKAKKEVRKKPSSAKKKSESAKKVKVDSIDIVEKICKDNDWNYSRNGKSKFLRLLDVDNKTIAIVYRRLESVRIYVTDVKLFNAKLIIKSDSKSCGKKFVNSIFVAVENIDKVLEIIVKNSKKEEK